MLDANVIPGVTKASFMPEHPFDILTNALTKFSNSILVIIIVMVLVISYCTALLNALILDSP